MEIMLQLDPIQARMLSDQANRQADTPAGVLQGVCDRWLREQQIMRNNAALAPVTLSTASQGPIDPKYFSFYGTQGDVQFVRRQDGSWAATMTSDPARHIGRPPLMVIKDDELIVRTDFEAMTAAAARTPEPAE